MAVCNACTNGVSCTVCIDPLKLTPTCSICIAGHYLSSGSCLSCPTACATCTGTTTC